MAYNDLSIRDKAQVIRMGVRAGLKSLKDIQSFYDSTAQHVDTEPLDEFAEGGSIHIKHPGRLTALKKRTGKSEAELWATGNAHTRKMITFARNARKWKHEDGGSTWLPEFTLPQTPSERISAFQAQQPLRQAVLQGAQIRQPQSQQALKNLQEREYLRQHGVVEENPGLIPVSIGADLSPIGDVEQIGDAIQDIREGNYSQAALGLSLLALPSSIARGVRARRINRAITKELSRNPLTQVIPDEEISNWLAERWYRNETHNLPPRIGEHSVDISEFDKYGIPDRITGADLSSVNPSATNTLIHVDHRLPLIPGRTGFNPLPSNGYDTPAVWWQRDYPYYPNPTELIPIGHTLKVKEGQVRALDPNHRVPGTYGPIVVTEKTLPYDALEGLKFNADQTWFERELFKSSPAKWDYFKSGPGWTTYSTGGIMYPFSFSKRPKPSVLY